MKNHKKLNLKKLSIAKLDVYLVQHTIKGGTDPHTGVSCLTSAKTNTDISIDLKCSKISLDNC